MRNKKKKEEKVFNEEACEFLILIRQSEYAVIDKLNRTSAKISHLSLMLNLEPPRKLLFKILNKVMSFMTS